MLCGIVKYFYELCRYGLVKIQTTSKNSYYYPSRQILMSVRENFADIYLFTFLELHPRVQTLKSVFVFFVVLLFLFSSINDEISLSSNCFSSFDFSNKPGFICQPFRLFVVRKIIQIVRHFFFVISI